MTNLALAFMLAVGGVFLSAYGLTFIGLPKEIAGSISSVVMGGVPYIHKVLDEKQISRKSSIAPDSLLSLEGYGLAQHRLIIYGTAVTVALLNVVSGVTGLIIGFLAAEPENAGIIVALLAPVSLFPFAFSIGRWIGTRAIWRGVLTVVIVALLARALTSLFDIIILNDQHFTALFGHGKSLEFFAGQLAGGTMLLGIPALLGYWRGRRRRLYEYMTYLLKSLPPASRETLVELTFEEAKKFALAMR